MHRSSNGLARAERPEPARLRVRILLAAALALSACGGNDDDSGAGAGASFETPRAAATAAGLECLPWMDAGERDNSEIEGEPPPEPEREGTCTTDDGRLQTSFLLYGTDEGTDEMVAWMERSYPALGLTGRLVVNVGRGLVTMTFEAVWEDETTPPQGPDAVELTERIAEELDLEVVTFELGD